jgi:hypothetical protein
MLENSTNPRKMHKSQPDWTGLDWCLCSVIQASLEDLQDHLLYEHTYEGNSEVERWKKQLERDERCTGSACLVVNPDNLRIYDTPWKTMSWQH